MSSSTCLSALAQPAGGSTGLGTSPFRTILLFFLPGSPKSVRENLTVIIPALRHALEKIKGDDSECGV